MTQEPVVVLEASNVAKAFRGIPVLRDINFHVTDGEVVGLIGENGAGKSTLLNILSGVVRPDSGDIRRSGEPFAPGSYREAMGRGVFRVYQEPSFVPTLTIAENMVLGLEQSFTRAGLIRKKAIDSAVARTIAPLGHLVSPSQIAMNCDANTLQAVEILRVLLSAELLGVEKPLVLLDEPTAALVSEETAILFETIEALRGKASFIFVSHRLSEIQERCERSYVLKDGVIVAEVGPQHREAELHALMVGRERADDFYLESRQRTEHGDTVLEIVSVSGSTFSDVSVSVARGEVVGVAGVVGSGKEELGMVVAGGMRRKHGEISIRGNNKVRDVIPARLRAGLGYVPRDRQTESVIGTESVARQLSLTAYTTGKNCVGPVVQARRQRVAAQKWVDRLRIRTPGIDALMSQLSGGNTQKVVVGRVLEADVSIVVLDNPTRGIDAGAKADIYELIRELTEADMAILLISDDLPEVIGLSNRIMIMNDGTVKETLSSRRGAKPVETDVIKAMV